MMLCELQGSWLPLLKMMREVLATKRDRSRFGSGRG